MPSETSYTEVDWLTGDTITATRLNQTDDEVGKITNEILRWLGHVPDAHDVALTYTAAGLLDKAEIKDRASTPNIIATIDLTWTAGGDLDKVAITRDGETRTVDLTWDADGNLSTVNVDEA